MTESVSRALFLRRRLNGAAPVVSVDASRSLLPTWRFRSVLTAGCAGAVALAGFLGDSNVFMYADPALGRLLRGMALIKGAIAIGIVAAVWWRFGRPVHTGVAAVYLMGSWVLFGSTMLVWQLSWIPLAAILFHAAALSMLLVSWRER